MTADDNWLTYLRNVNVRSDMTGGKAFVDFLIERAETGQASSPMEIAEVADKMSKLMVMSVVEILNNLGTLQQEIGKLRQNLGR